MQQSIRKHYSQMSEVEQKFLWDKLMNAKNWYISPHLQEKLDERGGTLQDAIDVISHGEIVEFHQRNGQSRVLLRGTKTFDKYVPCTVFQLHNQKVITMYWNHKDDHHRTLKEELYDEELDVISLFEQEMKNKKNQKRPLHNARR